MLSLGAEGKQQELLHTVSRTVIRLHCLERLFLQRLLKLNIHIPSAPTILLDISPQKCIYKGPKRHAQERSEQHCFLPVKGWEQHTCLSTLEWYTLSYIHTTEYRISTRMNGLPLHATT